jgi:ubiquitin-conjugating enzyme E2 O
MEFLTVGLHWHCVQVLVSIQGLVLVAEPYYNEAGFEKQVASTQGRRNAKLYNENTFLLCCKSTLCVLRQPPEGFEALVEVRCAVLQAHAGLSALA